MADPSELVPDLEPTLLGGPPPPFTDSSANMAARFAVLRDRPSDDHERADRPQPETDATRYEFGETFARGGLGRIRRAYDRRLQRFVAVKELQDPSRGGSAEARFMREALITARLEHSCPAEVADGPLNPKTVRRYLDVGEAHGIIAGEGLTDARLGAVLAELKGSPVPNDECSE